MAALQDSSEVAGLLPGFLCFGISLALGLRADVDRGDGGDAAVEGRDRLRRAGDGPGVRRGAAAGDLGSGVPGRRCPRAAVGSQARLAASVADALWPAIVVVAIGDVRSPGCWCARRTAPRRPRSPRARPPPAPPALPPVSGADHTPRAGRAPPRRTPAPRGRSRRRRIALAAIAGAALVAGALVGAGSDGDDPAAGEPRRRRPKLPARRHAACCPDAGWSASTARPATRRSGRSASARPRRPASDCSTRRAPTRGNRPVLPVLELLATIAASAPGEDGDYILRQPDRVIERYLDEARRIRGLLLLDIQPGRADFADEIDAPRALPARARRRPRARSRVARRPRRGPGQVIGSVEARDGERDLGRARGDRARARPAREAVRDPPVHRRDDRGPGRACATAPGSRPWSTSTASAIRRTRSPSTASCTRDRSTGLGSGFKLFYNEDIEPDEPRAGAGAEAEAGPDRLRVGAPLIDGPVEATLD